MAPNRNTVLEALINSQLPDNGINAITAKKLRDTLIPMLTGLSESFMLDTVETSVDVNPLVAFTKYQTDTSGGALTHKLPDPDPNPTTGNISDIFEVALAHNGNQMTLTTETGTALIGTSSSQIFNSVNDSMLVQVNAAGDGYYILEDRRHVVGGTLLLLALTELSTLPPYTRITTSSADEAYSETAIDGSTGALSSGLNTVGATITDPGLINGLLTETVITSLGQIRKTLGSGTATFYVEYYHVDSDNNETKIGTSNISPIVTSATYIQFSVSAKLTETYFEEEDRFLVKTIANWDGGGSAPTYEVQFEGPNPARGELSISIATIGVGRDSYITREPSGYSLPDDVVQSYDSTTRKVTVTEKVVGEGVPFYWRGQQIPAMITGWVSEAHPTDLDKEYMLQYNGTDFEWVDVTTTELLFSDAFVTFVHYGTADKFAVREAHGVWQWQGHRAGHKTIGTYKDIGTGTVSSITLDSVVAAERRPAVSEAKLWDEDNPTILPALVAGGVYTNFTLSGAGAVANFAKTAVDIVPLNTAIPFWNEFTGGAWQQTPMDNNRFMNVWLVGIPTTADTESQAYRLEWVQGQGQWATQTGVDGETSQGVTLGELDGFTNEFVFMARLSIHYTAANWSVSKIEALEGSKVLQVASPGGTFLSAVAVLAGLYNNGTVGSPLDAFEGSAYSEITYGATTTPSQSGGVKNFYIEATGNIALENMTDTIASSGGDIVVERNSVGDITMSTGTEYTTPNGEGIAMPATDGDYVVIPYTRNPFTGKCHLGESQQG